MKVQTHLEWSEMGKAGRRKEEIRLCKILQNFPCKRNSLKAPLIWERSSDFFSFLPWISMSKPEYSILFILIWLLPLCQDRCLNKHLTIRCRGFRNQPWKSWHNLFFEFVSKMLNSSDLKQTTGAVSPEDVTVQSFIIVKYSLFLQ